MNCPKPGSWAQLLKALPIRGLLPVPSPWRRGGAGGAVQSETSVQVAGAHLPSLQLPEQRTEGSQAASAQARLVRPPPPLQTRPRRLFWGPWRGGLPLAQAQDGSREAGLEPGCCLDLCGFSYTWCAGQPWGLRPEPVTECEVSLRLPACEGLRRPGTGRRVAGPIGSL